LDCVEGLERNASIRLMRKDKAFLVADRDIAAREEIYIDYGYEYWEFFFKNSKIAENMS
jgi:SET domain-containing protein